MKLDNVFQLEIAAVFANKRSLIIRLGFTLLLGLPFILISIPTRIQVSGLLVLMIFITFFGSSVSFVRCRNEGHYDKLKLLPIPIWCILGDMVVASSLIDCIQMGILLALFSLIYSNGITFAAVVCLSGLFIINVISLNILGMLLGLILKNNSEVHLFGALGAGVIAFLSGLLPAHPTVKGVIETIYEWNALSLLGKSLERITTGYAIANLPFALVCIFVLIVFLSILYLRTFNRGR